MPALDVDKPGVSAVETFGKLLSELVDEATMANDADLPNISERAIAALPPLETPQEDDKEADKMRQFAIIEGAARDLFDRLIASTPIEAPEFDKMWHFLDILSVLSDEGQCDPALVFWLIEELLDSQTITGCRVIFDYLESRRERITAKHFKQKNLVILRSCNELLRRLSRAEDTTFCGRVFIFMFQSFPLGDRSSVNLRGEYHVENVTSYEQEPKAEQMDVDAEEQTAADKRPDPNVLYPMFWSLQESFSQPLKLFDAAHFAQYKTSLETTMKAFEALQQDGPRNLKRKADDGEAPDAFNPKYLTSRDLFELEISDLSFRRHVLVQALIVTEFLLSQSAQGKQKLTPATGLNKAVTYAHELNEDDTKWATDMKKRISDYLRKGFDGPYFYRMVETVLARDKNWVFWKLAACPNIQRESVTPADFLSARSSASRSATSKRLRTTPMGAVSMDFLKSHDTEAALAALKEPDRSAIPALESFERGIADDNFEIGMPTNESTKAKAIETKSSKSWRALRIAARSKLAAFDKIDDPKNISVVFKDVIDEDEEDEEEPVAASSDMPSSTVPVVLVAPDAIVTSLLEKRPGVFGKVVRHTTREPAEGESNGKQFHFVAKQEFNTLRDGDRLVEYSEEVGTSTKAVEAVVEAGKVPLLVLDHTAAKFAMDMGFEARYVLVPQADEDCEGFALVVKGEATVGEIDAFVYGGDVVMDDAEEEKNEGDGEDGDRSEKNEEEDGDAKEEDDDDKADVEEEAKGEDNDEEQDE